MANQTTTTNTDGRTVAGDLARIVFQAAPTYAGAAVADALQSAMTAGPSGTARSWFAARNGERVSTAQVGPAGTWIPGPRTVDASKATYVLLDGSRRDYAGLRVIGRSSSALIVASADTTALFWTA